MADDKLTRIAIVQEDKCKPKKCKQECKKSCPVVRMGKQCIEVEFTSKLAIIAESLCIGCGICVKKCPFDAIRIINLPKNLERDTTNRYGPNSFKLHRLPTPRPGQVLGLVGTNGIGKSTALKILSGKLKPNLGRYEGGPNPSPEWAEILAYFRGSELQNYFTKLLEDRTKCVIKPQYVDHIPKGLKGVVGELLSAKNEMDRLAHIQDTLELNHILDRNISDLSGGELQRFAIGIISVQKADVYMFDEPSSYLDVKQRLKASRVIRSLLDSSNFVIVVEHDLSVIDYLSDFICVLYGVPGAYGVVTMPFGVREGINIFLAGFIPTENLRFREIGLTFKVAENVDELVDQEKHHCMNSYGDMTKTMQRAGSESKFVLRLHKGSFNDSEIVVLLGENGTGKTTFIRLLAGLIQADDGARVPEMRVSYKPQTVSPKFEGTVRQLLQRKIMESFMHPQFNTDVIKPLSIEGIIDQEVQHLSGGEIQRVALILALGAPAEIYLIDEPSAYLDAEQRLIAARVIKRFILHTRKSAFIVEHDFIMATYMADKVVVYEGTPGIDCTASSPQGLLEGMNQFLRQMEITFRRDPENFRPRINKMDSIKDKEQKAAGTFFFWDD